MKRAAPLLALSLLLLLSACGKENGVKADGPAPQLIGTPAQWARFARVVRHRRPTADAIDRLEATLAQNACVGSMDRWGRFYSYGLDSAGEVDEAKIDFYFRQAGIHGFRAERRITAPDEWANLDDGDYRLVIGSFDRASARIDIQVCGPNLHG